MTTGDSSVILTLRGVTIEQDNYINLLGVNIDKIIDFKFHVNEVIRKCAHQLNALRRQSRVLNVLAKKKVFNAFISITVLWCGSIETKLTLLDLKRYRKGQSG